MLDALGLNLKEIIFAVVDFLILAAVLGKFLYKPFLGALEARKKAIKDTYDQAEVVSRRADAKMAKYERRIANAEDEAYEIVKDGRKRAERQAQQIIEEANQKASEIMKRAEEATELEKAKAMDELREEIVDMVIMAAYAPLFCKKGFNKWNSNLIWFDNRGMWRSCNYWYQQLFSVAGNRSEVHLLSRHQRGGEKGCHQVRFRGKDKHGASALPVRPGRQEKNGAV